MTPLRLQQQPGGLTLFDNTTGPLATLVPNDLHQTLATPDSTPTAANGRWAASCRWPWAPTQLALRLF